MKTSRLNFGRKKRKRGDTDQLAAQLAPLEEQDRPAAEHQLGTSLSGSEQADRHFGEIIVDNENLRIPVNIVDTPEDRYFLGIEPVVLVVLIIMLGFIGFIAWQISLIPAR